MGLRDNLAYLVRGPGSGRRAGSSSAQILPFPVAPAPARQSWTYDSHIVTSEAAAGSFQRGFNRGPAPKTQSLAWDERDAWGLDLASRSWQGLTPTERKSILLDIYINNPHVSSSVDVISKRIFSGGFTVEKINEESKDNTAHYDQLMEFCLRVNPDWDFNQYGRTSIADELIYGECYTEILWKGGLPFNLIKVDCLTMGYRPDRYGRIDRYYQEIPSTQKMNYLDPKNIIRWWFPHPRASIDPFAPAEKVSDAVLIDKKMMNWMITFFQKGARFQYYIRGLAGENEADRFMTWFDNNVAGAKNAHRPPATWGNAEFAPLGNAGAIEMDFQKGLDRMETIVYGSFGVPPAAVSIIKTGALGGNSGEDQDKSLIFNACDPVKQQFLEKLNYRIVQGGFNIHDYRIGTRYADYRSDESVSKVEDMRIKNGSRTVDEIRLEGGKRPYKKGGSVPFIWSTKEVVPLARLDDLEEEQQQTAQVGLDTQKAQLEKIKNPPAPPPALLPNGQQQKQAQQPVTKLANKDAQKKQQAKEDDSQRPAILQKNTGMMVAFLLDEKTANQLALPDGEPASDLHVTLAFLGDTTDFVGSIDHLAGTLGQFASTMQPLAGKVSGIGRFSPSGSSDDTSPVIALVDMQGLQEFRAELVDYLASFGYKPANDFAYTPHITLSYIDTSASMPIKDIQPPVYLNFNQLCLAVGDERSFFPLNKPQTIEHEEEENELEITAKRPAIKFVPKGQKQEAAPGATDDIPASLTVWEPPNIEQTLVYLKSKGVATQTWRAHSGACSEICFPNDGHTVKIGESFPGGQRSTPAHPNCECKGEYRDAAGKILEVKDAEA